MLTSQSVWKVLCALFFAPIMSTSAQEIVSSPASSADEQTAVSPDPALQADLDNGSTIYDNACSACHGETGQGVQDVGPALNANLILSQVMLVVNNGRNTMPSFDVFTDQELVDISTFVVERMNR